MRLLDLFCGAGGAAMGYHRAGFDEIVGIDIEPQPDYPFEFIQKDVMSVRRVWTGFDLIHASPPCQDYTPMSNRWGSDQPRLIPAVRHLLDGSGIPYVIENVVGARSEMLEPITLTGEMFGLEVHRPRLFELGGWYCMAPARPPRQANDIAVYGKPDGRWVWQRKDGSRRHAWSSVEEGQRALGIDWTDDWHQIREAIPPAYTEYIGRQFIDQQAAL